MHSFTTPDLFDDHRDQVQVAHAGLQHYGGITTFFGQAFTVTCPQDNSKAVEALKQAGAGRVLVIDGEASLEYAFLGDVMAGQAQENGWAGVIVNGCVRDIEILNSFSLGVMAFGSTPKSTVKRGLGEQDQPVNMLGITIRNGDWLYADVNGLLVSSAPLV